ncbi:NAD(P)-binding protein [Venturia nashicola]|uniref:NAD(P)-binding protein n=1 Tax=Venturia nashicola TaxID=86259 RepID=A0A4Z1NYZ5_9PEZI|nr:NAD(P)-binding protein [Venturia nashicola]TLD14826.1 NAD(P)-binding protein [Venturia nashicola]
MTASKRTKTVLITGCSPGGIGHSLAVEFQSKGLQVLATARTKEKISDLKAKGITTLALDVDSVESIAELKKDVERITSGKLDYLVNNAGRNYTVPATDIDLSEVEATFRTNVFAVMIMCKTFAPLLIEAQGTIVQIGSVAAVMPYVFGSVYNASKAALHQYSNTLRLELKPFNVKVLTVVTGGVKSNIARTERQLPADSIYLPIDTEYQRRTKHSQEVGMPNEQYAKGVVASVLGAGKGRRHIWNGSSSWLVWFVTRFLPVWVFDLVFARMFSLWKLNKTDQKKLA